MPEDYDISAEEFDRQLIGEVEDVDELDLDDVSRSVGTLAAWADREQTMISTLVWTPDGYPLVVMASPPHLCPKVLAETVGELSRRTGVPVDELLDGPDLDEGQPQRSRDDSPEVH